MPRTPSDEPPSSHPVAPNARGRVDPPVLLPCQQARLPADLEAGALRTCGRLVRSRPGALNPLARVAPPRSRSRPPAGRLGCSSTSPPDLPGPPRPALRPRAEWVGTRRSGPRPRAEWVGTRRSGPRPRAEWVGARDLNAKRRAEWVRTSRSGPRPRADWVGTSRPSSSALPERLWTPRPNLFGAFLRPRGPLPVS
jgi:hypothetical protein